MDLSSDSKQGEGGGEGVRAGGLDACRVRLGTDRGENVFTTPGRVMQCSAESTILVLHN